MIRDLDSATNRVRATRVEIEFFPKIFHQITLGVNYFNNHQVAGKKSDICLPCFYTGKFLVLMFLCIEKL
jgi:hypothetical protein